MTIFDLYSRVTSEADGDDVSRKVGTVDASDLGSIDGDFQPPARHHQ